MISNTHRNGLVVAGTLIGDWLLAMLTYWLFMSLFLDVTWDEMQLHTSVVVGVLYCACIINGGVILYLREVKRFQIVTKVTRNVLLFAVVAIPLLKFGHFRTMDYDMVPLFLLALIVVVSSFRLCVRSLMNYYRKREDM